MALMELSLVLLVPLVLFGGMAAALFGFIFGIVKKRPGVIAASVGAILTARRGIPVCRARSIYIGASQADSDRLDTDGADSANAADAFDAGAVSDELAINGIP